jgi:hypothetical protein
MSGALTPTFCFGVELGVGVRFGDDDEDDDAILDGKTAAGADEVKSTKLGKLVMLDELLAKLDEKAVGSTVVVCGRVDEEVVVRMARDAETCVEERVLEG